MKGCLPRELPLKNLEEFLTNRGEAVCLRAQGLAEGNLLEVLVGWW